MLPFLKSKKQSSTVIVNEKSEAPSNLELISEQLIEAIHARDVKGVAEALRAIESGEDNE